MVWRQDLTCWRSLSEKRLPQQSLTANPALQDIAGRPLQLADEVVRCPGATAFVVPPFAAWSFLPSTYQAEVHSIFDSSRELASRTPPFSREARLRRSGIRGWEPFREDTRLPVMTLNGPEPETLKRVLLSALAH